MSLWLLGITVEVTIDYHQRSQLMEIDEVEILNINILRLWFLGHHQVRLRNFVMLRLSYCDQTRKNLFFESIVDSLQINIR
ncbi:hypothetical protein RIR_jg27090.t1 [Rhizophagus irregularis DAOM 181602=DAOM 197198]|nr:hypothetical protein RIR_jg27090.t1 [Rhizophagus irregularis DAOM 181602=DAOM 197198]